MMMEAGHNDKSLVLLFIGFLISLSSPISLFFLWHAQPTSDDLVSSAECSSDDEDFVECEPSTGRLGQSCFACFIFSFAKNNTYIYVNIHSISMSCLIYLEMCKCIHIHTCINTYRSIILYRFHTFMLYFVYLYICILYFIWKSWLYVSFNKWS